MLEERGRAHSGHGWGLLGKGEKCLVREAGLRVPATPRIQTDIIQAREHFYTCCTEKEIPSS